MPLPTARIAMPNVDSAGDPRPYRDARIDPEIRGVLRRRQSEYGALRLPDVPSLQWRDLRSIRAASAAPSTSRQADDRRARQRHVPPFPAVDASTAQISGADHIPLSSAVLPATVHDRARLEARAAAGNTQSIFRNPPRSAGRRYQLLPSVGETKQCVATPMLHYLRRCV